MNRYFVIFLLSLASLSSLPVFAQSSDGSEAAWPEDEPKQTAAARKLLLDWQGAGALVVVTHQVNITQLTGIYPASGEGIVLKKQGNELIVVARFGG